MEFCQLIINQAANALDQDVGGGDISAELIGHTGCHILDTRKTIPQLRVAYKHAVMRGAERNRANGGARQAATPPTSCSRSKASANRNRPSTFRCATASR